MNLDVTGSYTIHIPIQSMFLNTTLMIKGHNLVTQFGESFFMNRCINEAFNPIQYIAVGTASNNPRKTDLELGNETSRRKCIGTADLKQKQLRLTCNFPANEIVGVSEIGVFNDKIMISHDKFNKISEEFLGVSGDVNVEYIYQFTTGALKGGWQQANVSPFAFYAVELNNVVGVFEENTSTWYTKCDSLNQLSSTRASYYYDENTKNLYVRPKRDMNLTEFLDEEIIVQIR